jgi:hypothetical protein
MSTVLAVTRLPGLMSNLPLRSAPPNIDKLRDALHQRAEQWKAELRAEPKVARLLLRRLVGPLTLWDATEPSAAWIDCETSVSDAMLDGLVDAVHHMASPAGFDDVWSTLIAVEL